MAIRSLLTKFTGSQLKAVETVEAGGCGDGGTYSRAQAIKDGVLIDVTEQAKKEGFKVPVALTAGAWARCVAVTEELEMVGHTEEDRLSDLLRGSYFCVESSPGEQQHSVYLLEPTDFPTAVYVKLMMRCGLGDDQEPVVTIMLPEGGESVDSYVTCSRAEALSSGQLVDVSETAQSAGISVPTAVTRAVWGYITAPLRSESMRGTPETRELSILECCRIVMDNNPDAEQIGFVCLLDRDLAPGEVLTLEGDLHLKVVRGKGDRGEPVLTIVVMEGDCESIGTGTPVAVGG